MKKEEGICSFLINMMKFPIKSSIYIKPELSHFSNFLIILESQCTFSLFKFPLCKLCCIFKEQNEVVHEFHKFEYDVQFGLGI